MIAKACLKADQGTEIEYPYRREKFMLLTEGRKVSNVII